MFKPRTSEVSYESIYRLPICIMSFVWMFCSRISNNRINHLHERALRIVYNDHSSKFEDRLVKNNSFSIHHKEHSLVSNRIIKREVNYNIRSQRTFRSFNTSSYDLKSLRCLTPKIWNLVPQDIRSANSLSQFIWKIKLWIPDSCPCILCRTYIGQAGYVN